MEPGSRSVRGLARSSADYTWSIVSLRMSPPTVLSSTSKRSVLTVIGSPPLTTGLADGATGAVAVTEGAADGVVRVVVGFGTPTGALVLLGAGTGLGALCFCHASHNSSEENEKTTKAMSR